MKKFLLIAMLGAVTVPAFADEDMLTDRWWTPLQINVASPIGLLWSSRDVYGIRCNLLYGHSLDVYGIDCGVVGANYGDFGGVQANVFNYTDGCFRGIQIGPFGNFTVKNNYGLQVAGLLNWGLEDGAGIQFALFNFTAAYSGMQFGMMNWQNGLDSGLAAGVINVARADVEGGMVGFSNYCKGSLAGCQIGVFNMVFGHSDGVQIGVFNASEDHNGMQLGLFNLNAAGVLPLMPVLNVNFR